MERLFFHKRVYIGDFIPTLGLGSSSPGPASGREKLA